MIRAILLTFSIFFLLSGCLLGAAGTMSWPMAWAVLGIYSVSKIVALTFTDSELMKERAAPGPGVDRVDGVIAAVGYLGLYPGVFIVAGLDAVRFGPAVDFPGALKLMALLVFALGYGISTWAVLRNPFFSTFVRIQHDRGHAVVSSGPYALVRHPGYAGALVSHLVLPFALGSIWALIPALLGVIFFVLRTSREDRILSEKLDGYRAYQAKVHWRLLPRIW